jgi:hypothetical protein
MTVQVTVVSKQTHVIIRQAELAFFCQAAGDSSQ